uniref:Major facilitator superfamily (MFS) profile domain-containing protein n=1 Tax=Mycena chlorophos TaxID=658473 RepID=A0ABQ0M2G4_MYCCL|nr:predicted protein [Mycena chlorophos]
MVVGVSIATDLLVYSIVLPVVPFRLETLGYTSVSALTGWLLFAFSGGLALCTIPAAMLSERYNNRRVPILLGLVLLIGSQIMFMEAPNFAVMCVARVIQGFASTAVWVVGLALLCDCTPEQFIGRQLGFAMAGMSIGFLVGPPLGGALYTRLGWRAPFIAGIIMSLFDLIGRLLIIERKDALQWGVDPAAPPTPATTTSDAEKDDTEIGQPEVPVVEAAASGPVKHLSLVGVMARLGRSSRAVVCLILTFIFGIIYAAQEPTLTLHLQAVWGLDSAKVGIVYIASVVPGLFSSPISGYYTDRFGVEWISFICFLLATPWWGVMIVQRSLAVFITAFALGFFFVSAILSPLTAELAAVSRRIEGVGYGHIYGAFNLIYGVGTTVGPVIGGQVAFFSVLYNSPSPVAQIYAHTSDDGHIYGAFNLIYGVGTTVGPVIGGQIYAHTSDGWTIIMVISVVVLALSCLLSFVYIGDNPLVARLVKRRRRPAEVQEN